MVVRVNFRRKGYDLGRGKAEGQEKEGSVSDVDLAGNCETKDCSARLYRQHLCLVGESESV